MGGAPTIQGGMTKAEQEQLLADERRYQQEQEDARRERAKADEKEREAAAQAERERIKAEEAARIAEADIAEQEAIDAATSMEEEEEGREKLTVDFYGSLYNGVGSRPTTRTNTTRPA